jgi:hypothetical protein
MGSLVLAGATSGSTTITPSATGTYTITLPAETGTIQTSGSGFTTNGVAYASSTSALTTGSAITFDGTNLILGSANPNFQGSSSTGSATLINNSGGAYIRVYGGSHATKANYTEFVNASSTITITSAGNVGIGTSSPDAKLKIVVSAGSNALVITDNTSSDFFVTPAVSGGVCRVGPSAGAMALYANNIEAARIDSSGNLLVNTTSASAGGKVCINAQCYSANGLAIKDTQEIYTGTTYFAVFVNSAGTLAGGIQHNASTTVNYVTSSDARLKTLIKVATETSVIDNIVINDFTWKENGKVDRGVFAQDAQKIIPNAISEGTDELTEENNLKNPWGVDYSKFVPDLIVHAQQLKKQVQELNTLITAQSATITSLTERITALEGK